MLSAPEKITFGEMANLWLEEYKNSGLVKRTSVTTRTCAMNVLLKHFDKIGLQKISPAMLQQSVNKIAEQYSKVYTREIVCILKFIYKKAKQIGAINTNPTEFLYIPKQRKSLEEIESEPIQNKYLEKDVLKKFLDVAKNYGLDYDYTFFRVLAYTGVRVGEALALKWSDIDFENQSISINRRITHEKNNLNEFELDTPKTQTSKRIIPVDSSIIVALNELKTFQKWFRSKYAATPDFGFVFINLKSKKGYPQTQKHVELRLNRIKRMAGIEQHITAHMFRHTHTSLLAEAGVELTTIMERLGHKNDDITKEIYLHVTKSLKQEAVEKFSKLMNE
jgi:integrase